MPLQYGHGERQNLRSCPVARPDRQLAPRESESESNGTTTRRRIAVAVGFSLRNKFEPFTDIFNSAAAVASEKSNVAETPEMVWAARIAGLLAQTRATSIVYVRCCYHHHQDLTCTGRIVRNFSSPFSTTRRPCHRIFINTQSGHVPRLSATPSQLPLLSKTVFSGKLPEY